jgi:hypothetical protein
MSDLTPGVDELHPNRSSDRVSGVAGIDPASHLEALGQLTLLRGTQKGESKEERCRPHRAAC